MGVDMNIPEQDKEIPIFGQKHLLSVATILYVFLFGSKTPEKKSAFQWKYGMELCCLLSLYKITCV